MANIGATFKKLSNGSFLLIQWLGFQAFTTRVPVQFPVGDLPCSGKLKSPQATGHSKKNLVHLYSSLLCFPSLLISTLDSSPFIA